MHITSKTIASDVADYLMGGGHVIEVPYGMSVGGGFTGAVQDQETDIELSLYLDEVCGVMPSEVSA